MRQQLGVVPSGTKDATTKLYVDSGRLWCPTMSLNGVLTTGIGVVELTCPFACTLLNVLGNVSTAPTTQSVIVDFNKNAVTVFTTQTNRIIIAAGTKYDVSGVPDITAFALGDVFTVDIDQIGTGGQAGSNLCVTPVFRIT